MENRLQQAEQRFGATIARNQELRAEIESMGKQREAFDQGQVKSENELQAMRAEVMALRDATSIANEARMAAKSQLEVLRIQASVCGREGESTEKEKNREVM